MGLTITELLLLPPKDLVGKVRVVGSVEGLADGPLLDAGVLLGNAGSLLDHLLLRTEVHGHLEEIGIEERDAGFDAPGRHGLVAPQTVVHVEAGDLVDGLVVELLGVGGLVEVEVAAEDLVGALPRQDHLDAHGLDLAAHEVHGRRGTDGGQVVRFEGADDLPDGIGSLVEGVGVGVVDGPEVVGHLLGGEDVGTALEADGEGMELGKVGRAAGDVPGADGGDQRRVESTRQKDAPGNVGHHPAGDGLLEGVAEDVGLVRVGRRGKAGLHFRRPRRLEPALEGVGVLPLVAVDVSRGEVLELGALADEGLHLGRDVDGAIVAPANVEGGDANVIPGGEEEVLLLVVQDEGEYAAELGREVDGGAMLGVQRKNDLAITARLGRVGRSEGSIQLLVVVNLTIGRNDDVAIGADQGLLAGFGVHNGQTLVADAVSQRSAGRRILAD